VTYSKPEQSPETTPIHLQLKCNIDEYTHTYIAILCMHERTFENFKYFCFINLYYSICGSIFFSIMHLYLAQVKAVDIVLIDFVSSKHYGSIVARQACLCVCSSNKTIHPTILMFI
jgi:uncharacterized protein YjaG (DUF416 family)